MKCILNIGAILAIFFTAVAIAGTEEDADDFMQIHRIESVLHQAGTTKNLDLMMSLFADDATIASGGKTYRGKHQIRAYWQAAEPFQSQNQWVAYTPAFRLKYSIEGPILRKSICR